jgi:hypothetical protein
MFAGKAGAYPSEAYLSGTPLYGMHLALPTKIRQGWKTLPGGKHSSLLRKFVHYRIKIFMALVPGKTLELTLVKITKQAYTRNPYKLILLKQAHYYSIFLPL